MKALLAAAFFFFSISISTFAYAKDFECATIESIDPRTKLVLKEAHTNQFGEYFGRFELTNIGFESTITLRGRKESDGFHVEYPTVYLQFKDLNANWVSLIVPTGSYQGGKDTISLGKGETKVFVTTLLSQDVANLNASDFRIVLQTFDAAHCFASTPFYTLPVRMKSEGLKSK